MEMSYTDLLLKLQTDVESDTIPQKEKAAILDLIYRLEDMLWRYSA